MTRPAFAGRRALVVDDEEMVRSSVSGMLKVLGFSVDTAWDGSEGIKSYQRALEIGQPYALVILDLVVPLGKGAEETVRELVRIDPGVRAVVTSGYSDHPVVQSHRQYGFVAFLKKPFGIKEIKTMLQQIETAAPR